MSVGFPGGAPIDPSRLQPAQGDSSPVSGSQKTVPLATTSPAARPAQEALKSTDQSAKGTGAKTVQNHSKSKIFATMARWVSSFSGGKAKAPPKPPPATPNPSRPQNSGPLQGASQAAPSLTLPPRDAPLPPPPRDAPLPPPARRAPPPPLSTGQAPARAIPPPSLSTPPPRLLPPPPSLQTLGLSTFSPPSTPLSAPRSATSSSIKPLDAAPKGYQNKAFDEALDSYREAISSVNVSEINKSVNLLEGQIAQAPEGEQPMMKLAMKSAQNEGIGNIEPRIEAGINKLQTFVSRLMNCTNPSEMKQLIRDANKVYEEVSSSIQRVPRDQRDRLTDLLTKTLVPAQVTSGKGSLNIAAADTALRSTRQEQRLPAETDPALVIAVVKQKIVSDMIRVGVRPIGDRKADAQFAEQLLRDASKDIHFGNAVNGDQSITVMRQIVDGWRLVGPNTEGMSEGDLDKLTASQNMSIRDFYGTSVKIDRYLSLMEGIVPLLREEAVLPESSLKALEGLVQAQQAMKEMRSRFEGSLNPEARKRLDELNILMVEEKDGGRRGKLQQEATKVFLEGIDQGKALEYLASPEMMSALSGVARFIDAAPAIMGNVTAKLGELGNSATEIGGEGAQPIIQEAERQNIAAGNVLKLTNTLINSLITDVTGGFNNGTQELLRNLPEDHERKGGIMNNFAQLKRLLAGS